MLGELTNEVISYSRQLHQVLELWMAQHLAGHRVFPGVLHNDLVFALLVLLDFDDSWREALLKLLLMLLGDRRPENDVGQETV